MHCTRCDERMALNHETTKLNEYACDICHNTEIEPKTPVAGRAL